VQISLLAQSGVVLTVRTCAEGVHWKAAGVQLNRRNRRGTLICLFVQLAIL